MKRSEMLDHIREELEELADGLETCTTKRRPHLLRSKADTILSFMEGFGMLPPPSKEYDNVPTVSPTGNLMYEYKRKWEDE